MLSHLSHPDPPVISNRHVDGLIIMWMDVPKTHLECLGTSVTRASHWHDLKFEVRQVRASSPTSAIPCCVTLRKSFHLSEPVCSSVSWLLASQGNGLGTGRHLTNVGEF